MFCNRLNGKSQLKLKGRKFMTKDSQLDVTRRNFLYGIGTAGAAMGVFGMGNPAEAGQLFAKGDDVPRDAEGNIKAYYTIKEVYPRKGKVLGTLRYGEEFFYDMPNNSAVVLELEPAPSKTQTSQSIEGNQQKQVQIIPAFSSIKSKNP